MNWLTQQQIDASKWYDRLNNDQIRMMNIPLLTGDFTWTGIEKLYCQFKDKI